MCTVAVACAGSCLETRAATPPPGAHRCRKQLDAAVTSRWRLLLPSAARCAAGSVSSRQHQLCGACSSWRAPTPCASGPARPLSSRISSVGQRLLRAAAAAGGGGLRPPQPPHVRRRRRASPPPAAYRPAFRSSHQHPPQQPQPPPQTVTEGGCVLCFHAECSHACWPASPPPRLLLPSKSTCQMPETRLPRRQGPPLVAALALAVLVLVQQGPPTPLAAAEAAGSSSAATSAAFATSAAPHALDAATQDQCFCQVGKAAVHDTRESPEPVFLGPGPKTSTPNREDPNRTSLRLARRLLPCSPLEGESTGISHTQHVKCAVLPATRTLRDLHQQLARHMVPMSSPWLTASPHPPNPPPPSSS